MAITRKSKLLTIVAKSYGAGPCPSDLLTFYLPSNMLLSVPAWASSCLGDFSLVTYSTWNVSALFPQFGSWFSCHFLGTDFFILANAAFPHEVVILYSIAQSKLFLWQTLLSTVFLFLVLLIYIHVIYWSTSTLTRRRHGLFPSFMDLLVWEEYLAGRRPSVYKPR